MCKWCEFIVIKKNRWIDQKVPVNYHAVHAKIFAPKTSQEHTAAVYEIP